MRQGVTPVALAILSGTSPALAQGLMSKTANIETPEPAPLGELHFPFTHRFWIGAGKVSNSPTFGLSTGIVDGWTSVGVRYATNSALTASPNEIEFHVKQAILRTEAGMPLELTSVLAYNAGAGSVDGALVLGRRFGPFALLGAVRGFSNAFGLGGPTVAATLGAQWRLTRFLLLSADAGGILAAQNPTAIRATSNTPAWSVAAAFEIPFSPHSVQFYVTNAQTISLQGASRGDPNLVYGGFEFNIPFTGLGRWAAIFNPPPETPPAPASGRPAETPAAPAPLPVETPPRVAAQTVTIRNFAYQPAEIAIPAATTVRWVNMDTVAHTATSDKAGDWDSGLVAPKGAWEHTFAKAGTFPYHCTPHPFMVGKVVVN